MYFPQIGVVRFHLFPTVSGCQHVMYESAARFIGDMGWVPAIPTFVQPQLLDKKYLSMSDPAAYHAVESDYAVVGGLQCTTVSSSLQHASEPRNHI